VKYTAISIGVKHFTAYFLLGQHARALRLTVETSVPTPQRGCFIVLDAKISMHDSYRRGLKTGAAQSWRQA
ncbi:MAG: hypothetical protein ABW276_01090, partial [Casimicrobiaceae bacterium]